MSNNVKELISSRHIVEFTYPRLHIGKFSYVDFFAYDPLTGNLRRKKYMLNRCKSVEEKKDRGALIIHNVIERLKVGWSPFVENESLRQYIGFNIVLERYETYVKTMAQKKSIREKTSVDYMSRVRRLKEFMSENGMQIKCACNFDRNFAIEFLDYLIMDKEVSATTRNNYRIWLATFANWMIERKYITENPITDIRIIREDEKKRDALTPTALRRLNAYLRKNNRPFYLACLMEYYTFIRPEELRNVKIGDISVAGQSIYVGAGYSKNRKGQYVALNDIIIKEMIRQRVFDHPSQEYLFGWDMIPGPEMIYINKFRQEWQKVREALNFPMSYQFYSLKDSGIRDLANAEGIIVARDQARHSDVSITNRYLKTSKSVHEGTKHFHGNLDDHFEEVPLD